MRRRLPLVIAGLDPAIHPLRKTLAKMMDTRVKRAYAAEYVVVIASAAKQSRGRAEIRIASSLRPVTAEARRNTLRYRACALNA